MSATVGFWGIWASIKAIKNKGIAYKSIKEVDGEQYSVFGYNLLTLTIYFLSMTVGLVGTISLVVEHIHQPQVWKITAAFAAVIFFFGLTALIIGARRSAATAGTSVFGVVSALMLVLGAFYSDWILAALAGNLVGVPSGDTAVLYWVSDYVMFKDAIVLMLNRHILRQNAYRCSLLERLIAAEESTSKSPSQGLLNNLDE